VCVLRSYKSFGDFVFWNQGKFWLAAFAAMGFVCWVIDAAKLVESLCGRVFGGFLLLLVVVVTYASDQSAQRSASKDFKETYTEAASLSRRVSRPGIPRTDAERLLGISRRDSPERIKQAFWRAAKRCHPDFAPRNHMSVEAATKEFQRLQAAYKSLRA